MQMRHSCVSGALQEQALRQGAPGGTSSARTRRSASSRSSLAAALAGWGAGSGAAWAAGAAPRGPPGCTSSAAAPAAEEVGRLPDSKAPKPHSYSFGCTCLPEAFNGGAPLRNCLSSARLPVQKSALECILQMHLLGKLNRVSRVGAWGACRWRHVWERFRRRSACG